MHDALIFKANVIRRTVLHITILVTRQ